MNHVEHNYRLLTAGWLPGWLGLLLAAAAGALVVWQHRREFAHIRPSMLTRRALPVLRLLIVGLFVWLLCRPEFLVTTRWQEKPALLLITDPGASMAVTETFRGSYEKLDVLGHLRLQPLEATNRACSRVARLASGLESKLTAAQHMLRGDQDRFANGLPPTADFPVRLERLGTELDAARAVLQAARDDLPRTIPDETLTKELGAFTQKTVVLASLVKNQAQELPLFKKTVTAHPEALEPFNAKLAEAATAAHDLQASGGALQDKLDERLVDQKLLETCRQQRVTRRRLADQLATNLQAQLRDHYQLVTPPGTDATGAGTARAALAALFEHRLNGSLAGAVFLSDGCATWETRDRARLALLRDTPVTTVLIGRDAVAPADAGLLAAEAPAVVVRGASFVVRALVLNNLPPNAAAKLTVTCNGRTLGAVALPAPAATPATVEVPVVLEQIGRCQLRLEASTGSPDAFPGNEQVTCTVDVLTEPPKFLIVSGGLSTDVAACRGALAGLGFDPVETLLAEPGLPQLATGPDTGAFPATAEQWRRVRLAILLGRVPPALPDSALAGLKEAVAAGLHVLVQSSAAESTAGADAKSWTRALGLEIAPVPAAARLASIPDQWLEAYDVGAAPADSRQRLAALPALDGLMATAATGFAVLRADTGDVVKLLPREKGQILFAGLPRLALLRQAGNAQTANRLLAGLITLALRPVAETDAAGTRFTLFPPQPVAGQRLVLSANVKPAGSTAPAAAVSGQPFTVPAAAEIELNVGGNLQKRLVTQPRNRADFALTPNAATLAAIAQATGGTATELLDLDTERLPKLLPPLQPVPRSEIHVYPLWTGLWPLLLLLGLVAAEYLLRRRAGRVM